MTRLIYVVTKLFEQQQKRGWKLCKTIQLLGYSTWFLSAKLHNLNSSAGYLTFRATQRLLPSYLSGRCRHSFYRSILSDPCLALSFLAKGTGSSLGAHHPFLGSFWFRTRFLLTKRKAKWLPCSKGEKNSFQILGDFLLPGSCGHGS